MWTPPSLRSSCLCGAVRYTLDGPASFMVHCHCSICRKHGGAVFATVVGAPLMGFKWQAGQEAIQQYASSEKGRRPFCRHCGSLTPILIDAMDLAMVPAGNLKDDPGARPQAHIFVGSKASWYEITDGLPQHEAYPPEVGAPEVAGVQRDITEGIISGSCLCNEVAFEICGTPRAMRHCHCSRCRRACGAAHMTNVFYTLDDFRFVRGEQRIEVYAVPGTRFTAAFCRRCGGAAPKILAEQALAVVPAGIMDTDPGSRPSQHIFVGSKAPWFTISDDLPQFEAGPPS